MIFEAFCRECDGIVAVSKDIPQKDMLKLEKQLNGKVGCKACRRAPDDPRLDIGMRPQVQAPTKEQWKRILQLE